MLIHAVNPFFRHFSRDSSTASAVTATMGTRDSGNCARSCRTHSIPPMRGMCRSISTTSNASSPLGSSLSFSRTSTPSLAMVTSLCPHFASTAHATFMLMWWSSASKTRSFFGIGLNADERSGCCDSALWFPVASARVGVSFPRRFVSALENRSVATAARSFCRRACCSGFGITSASRLARKSSTCSSTSVNAPRVSPPLPEGELRLSRLARDKPSMFPQLSPSPESLRAYPGQVSRMNFGRRTVGVDASPSPSSCTLPATSKGAPPRGAICLRDSAHRRIASTNVLLFSATTMSYGASFASQCAPASSAATIASEVDACVTDTPHRSIAALSVCRIILLSSNSKTRSSRPLQIELKFIVDGVRTMLFTVFVVAPLARTARRAAASFFASIGHPRAPPGTGAASVSIDSTGTGSHRMLKWNVLPMPRPGDSAHIRPPIASHRRWLMARPSPVPSYLRVGDRSTCWNEWKMVEMLELLRPIPVSFT